MKLLLDTCALLWLAESPWQLSEKSRRMILENPAELFVSAISAFEVGVKHRKGKLDLKHPPGQWWKLATGHHRVSVLPVTDDIALSSTALPGIHHDPCDRIIIATADDIGATILTPDHLIAQYPSAKVAW